MLSVFGPKTHIKCFGKYLFEMLLLAIALLVFQSKSFAQQGTLTDNATFPASVSALTVQGSSATEGSAASFIKFKLTPNLPSTTPGSLVAKATLTLYVGSLQSSGSFNVYRVTSPWGEGDTTAPTYDVANPVVIGVPVTSANSYATVDVTALAQQWLGTDGLGAGGAPNYGIALVSGTATTAFSFDSKESTTTSHPARLTVLLNHVATADAATNFTGSLAGDVTGTQNGTVVSSVGSQSAANVANSTMAVSSATNDNAPGTIVRRDAAGNFSAGTIDASITGNAATATLATNATNADIAKRVVRAAQDSDIVSAADGQVYYDTTLNVFKVFDGPTSTWKIVNAGAAATLSSSATISGNQVSGELTNATIAGNRVTGNIAAEQISGNLTNTTIAGYVAKVGDTMTGTLNLPANGLMVGSTQMVLSGGNVGIGTISPQDPLHVNGSIRVDTLGSAGSTQLCRNASNQIASCSSSLRYKTQIAPFSGGLEIVNRLRPISFTWRDHPERDFGLGAEQVAAIEPLLVTRNAQGQIEGVKYDRVSIVLVNAIKQQQEQLTQQQREIESLKKLVCQDHPEATVCRQQ